MIDVTVYGEARPAGALAIGRTREGRSFLHHRDDAGLREWKNAIRAQIGPLLQQPYTGAVSVTATFHVQRPAGHYGKRGLRPTALAYPIKRSKGDVDKLARAVLDALTGVAVLDDAQVVDLKVSKRFADTGPVRLELRVQRKDDELDVLSSLDHDQEGAAA